MATPIRAMVTRVCIPSSARRLQSPSSTHYLNQNDSAIRRRIDVERVRADLERYKIEDEIMRDNLSRESRFYKAVEWSSYAILSLYAATFTAIAFIETKPRER